MKSIYNWKKEYFRLRRSNNQEDLNNSLEVKRQHLPKFLYRYRSFRNKDYIDRIISELSGFVYLSNVKYFNDPYDTKAILEEGQKIYLESSKDDIAYAMSNYFTQAEINHILSKENWCDEMIALGSASKSEIIKAKDDLLNVIKKRLLHITNCFNKYLEEGIRITCFTERYDNLPMWDRYANEFKGYCLEYDTTKIKDMLYIDRLFPVNYVAKLRELAQDLIEYDNGNASINIGNIIDEYATTKLNDWAYEEEWRLVMKLKMLTKSENDSLEIIKSDGHTIMFTKPSRVLLGAKMNKDDLHKIQDECKKLDVGVSFMELGEDCLKFI